MDRKSSAQLRWEGSTTSSSFSHSPTPLLLHSRKHHQERSREMPGIPIGTLARPICTWIFSLICFDGFPESSLASHTPAGAILGPDLFPIVTFPPFDLHEFRVTRDSQVTISAPKRRKEHSQCRSKGKSVEFDSFFFHERTPTGFPALCTDHWLD